MEKCVNCQYYDRRDARPTDARASVMWGQCRRDSPHLSPLNATKAYLVEGVWPLIRDDDWCGEWRAPTQSSVARARFTPRAVEVTSTAAAAAPASAPAAMPLAIAGD
jgi:hypothetical protein